MAQMMMMIKILIRRPLTHDDEDINIDKKNLDYVEDDTIINKKTNDSGDDEKILIIRPMTHFMLV